MRTNFVSQKFGPKGTAPTLLAYYQSYGLKGHNGWDWVTKDGEPLYWDCDIRGEVMDCHIDRNGGWGVRIITQDKDGNFKHLFWHLKEFKCQAGQILESGDLIGLADSTGKSTGHHLHRGIKPVHMTKYGWRNDDNKNGYYGAIDPAPYFVNIYIKDYMRMLQNQLSILKKMVGFLKKIIQLKIEIK